jgi:hypothetical protein
MHRRRFLRAGVNPLQTACVFGKLHEKHFSQENHAMKSQRSWLAAATVALALTGCASMEFPAVKSYSPDEIVAMSKTGKKPAEVVQTLKDGRAYYALPASELARMSKDGAPDEVINYLQASNIEAARQAERQNIRLETPFWYGHFYGPRICYRSFGGRGSWVTCF